MGDEVNNISYYLREKFFFFKKFQVKRKKYLWILKQKWRNEKDVQFVLTVTMQKLGFAAVRLYATSIALIFVCDAPKKILIHKNNFFLFSLSYYVTIYMILYYFIW